MAAATLTTRAGRTAPGLVPAVLALVAAMVRLPTFLSSRALSFDDGVYGASVVDMRRGLIPYRDLFSSQGPLHFPLLYAGDVLGLHTIYGPRLTPLVAGIVTAIAIWASALRLGAIRVGAAVAGLLVATTGTMLWTTGQITGDGPAAAFTALAVWAALVYRDDPRWWRALLAGALFGSALATKPIAVVAVVPLAVWLLARHRRAHVCAAAFTVVWVWLAAALPWGLVRVWRQSVEYHTGAGPSYPAFSQLGKLTITLATRDAVIVAVVVLGLVAAARAGPPSHASSDVRLLKIWLALVAIVLVFEKAMFANHLAAIILPLGLLVAVRPPPLRWLGIALVVLVPWEVAIQRDILWPGHMTGADAQVVARLHRLPHGAEAIADDPGLVWRAGLTTPAQMNDTTDMRIFQGGLTTRVVADAAASAHTCAVVITPVGFGRQLSGLRDAIAAVGYHLAYAYGHDRELWLRPCTK
jgi:4-amino-4-deoxy-L-arabinose transferase-like glycosyltransferase